MVISNNLGLTLYLHACDTLHSIVVNFVIKIVK